MKMKDSLLIKEYISTILIFFYYKDSDEFLPSSDFSLLPSASSPSMVYLLDLSLSLTLMSSPAPCSSSSDSLSTFWNLLLNTRLMELTLGTDDLSQIPSFNNRSLISQLNIPGLSRLYCSIFFSTSGVATRGLLPPMTPGRILPVSWYLCRILLTHPWDTLNCRLMTHGRTP